MSASREFLDDLRTAAVLVVGIAALGAVLGLVWSAWSPAGPRAFVYRPGRAFAYEESESWVAADGRYLVLTVAVGLLVGLGLWLSKRNRGVLVILALAAGGLGGALLTDWVGYLTGGGTDAGPVNTIIRHLPLSLHMHGLWFLEPAVAVLVYALLAAFTTHDDLGRPDPVREAASVDPVRDAQDGRRYGDAAGVLQQHQFPPQ